jgi:hypothetical protein
MPRAARPHAVVDGHPEKSGGGNPRALESPWSVSDPYDLNLRPAHERAPVAANPGAPGECVVRATRRVAGVMPFSGNDNDDES